MHEYPVCQQCGGELPPDVLVGMPTGFGGICGIECFLQAAAL